MVVVSWVGAHSRVGVVPQVGLCRGRILLHFGAGQDQRSCTVGLESGSVKINDFVYAEMGHTFGRPAVAANDNINKSDRD